MIRKTTREYRVPHKVDACIFCGAGKVTKEDFMPLWMKRLYRSGPVTGGMRHQATRYGEKTYSGMQWAAWVVCKRCNNEWMSRVQEAAKSVMIPLITSLDERSLTPTAQIILIRWATMTAMVQEFHDSNVRIFFNQAERRHVMTSELPLPQAGLMLATRHPNENPSTVMSRFALHLGFSVNDEGGSQPLNPNGYTFSGILGHLILQLIYARGDAEPVPGMTVINLSKDLITQGIGVLIPNRTDVQWPLEVALDNPSARYLLDRFSTLHEEHPERAQLHGYMRLQPDSPGPDTP